MRRRLLAAVAALGCGLTIGLAPAQADTDNPGAVAKNNGPYARCDNQGSPYNPDGYSVALVYGGVTRSWGCRAVAQPTGQGLYDFYAYVDRDNGDNQCAGVYYRTSPTATLIKSSGTVSCSSSTAYSVKIRGYASTQVLLFRMAWNGSTWTRTGTGVYLKAS